jgi:2,4-dienoyl-CoA reductase-like NADH-dependent reductase (Old Yellow Enzyme family)/thioredoxin reductase
MGSNYINVFTPITIRGVEFKNRIEMAPTSPKFTTKEGYVTQEHIDYFRAVARGGAAIVTMGNCSVDIRNARDEPRHMGLDDNDYISGLGRMIDMCDRHGIICSAEINHAGLDSLYDFTHVPAIGPSPMMMEKELQLAAANSRTPVLGREMSYEQIQETIRKYVEGAYRCKVAGFKMCMVHGGHGNLISQFASPLFNKRTDEYGGKLENRARFAIEVLDGIRRKCGEKFVIEFRVSADEMHPDGMHFEETKDFLKLLEDKVDIVNVSCGLHSHFKYFRYWSPNMYMKHMINVPYAAELKKILKCRVTAVAGIANLDEAEKIISEGWADFVAMARPLMADPDMVRKYAYNQPEEHRPCIRCGYCGRRMMAERTTACAVNPKLGREHELIDGAVIPAKVKKKVAVVGAGPAGMQAALTLTERGHDVTLFEKEPVLGGNLIAASSMDLKTDMKEYLDYIRRQVVKSGVELLLNTEVTLSLMLELRPDAIVIAAGSTPNMPRVPGIDLPHVHWAADADMGKCLVGDNVVVVGGGSLGLESAVTQSSKGKKVTVIELLTELPMNADKAELLPMLKVNGAAILTGRRLSEIRSDSIVCTVLGSGKYEEYACDTVLISAGMVPRKELCEELRHLIPETEVYIVGDAKEPRTIGDAVREGFDAALNI